jgi:hypothetical protein
MVVSLGPVFAGVVLRQRVKCKPQGRREGGRVGALRYFPYTNVQKNRNATNARNVAKQSSSVRREMPCAMRTPKGAASTLTGTMIAALRRET